MKPISKIDSFSPIWLVPVLAVFCNIIWGTSFALIKKCYVIFSINTIPSTLVFAGIRFVIAGILLFIFISLKEHHFPAIKKNEIGPLSLLGTLQTLACYLFFYIGLSNTSGTSSSIVNSMGVFFATFFAHFFFKNDRLTLRKTIGCLLGFAGVLSCLAGQGSSSFSFLGEGFVLLGAAFFALGANYSKIVTRTIDVRKAVAWNLFIGGLELLIIGLIFGGKLVKGTFTGYAIFAFLALVSSVSFVIWSWLLKNNPVGMISIYQFINPISGTLFCGIILGENILQLKYILALTLVTAGIMTIFYHHHSSASL